MKKNVIAYCLTFMCIFTATAAMADSIAGRFGVNGRFGFLVPADSEATFPPPTFNIGTDVGFVGGGGFIYGFNRKVALEMDITHTDFDGNIAGSVTGNFETTNISLGAQYRLNDLMPHLTPYVGGGLDILLNDFTNIDGVKADVDTVVGVHLSGGADYFVMRRLALTSEMKLVIAPDADINVAGLKVGNFDPMSFSMTFGVRYFFN